MEFSDFFDACRSVASSVGELASLLAAAALSYLAVVLRSLVRRMDNPQSLTRSALGSAPVRRRRGPSAARSSSALPGASAANSSTLPLLERNEDGISQAPVEPAQVSAFERFVSSVPPQERAALERESRADGPNSVGRPADPQRDPDGVGPDVAGGSAASGIVLGDKRS